MATSEVPVRVLLLSEGTYPFALGGVSNWCDMLVNDLSEVEFDLLSIIGDPRLNLQYRLPRNVIGCHPLVIWGIREVMETQAGVRISQLISTRRRANEQNVAAQVGGHIELLLRDIFVDNDVMRFAKTLQQLYIAFHQIDFDRAMRSQAVWRLFLKAVQELFPQAVAAIGYPGTSTSLAEVADAHTLLYHWLMPLATNLPSADVVHAVSAGLCSMLGVVARLEYGMPFLLTEHGIYLRERYLAELDCKDGLFAKLFRTRFARLVTEASYRYADQISPGSNYNHRWEIRNGAPVERICTIYNGVDPQTLVPGPVVNTAAPIVVWVGRITPIKDVKTMVRAAAVVHQERPTVRFVIYGTPPKGSESYLTECLALRNALGLAEVVDFRGFAPSIEIAFQGGDIVALSSISEGFPFTVIEAMLCARPVVASAVGGVPEALREDCGITVEPSNPKALAAGIIRLVDDPELRVRMGALARVYASQTFTLAQCSAAYRESYRTLAMSSTRRDAT